MAEEREEKDFIELLSENIGTTGTELQELEIGSEERVAEAKIFDMQAKLALDEYKLSNEVAINEAKIALEHERLDREMELKREMELRRIAIEEDKAKTEKRTLWTKVILTGVEIGSGITLGWAYLKYNLIYGGMMGKDAKEWFKEIRRIKL